jgi:pimeloyl-ACP methyl ester carboxylesterase
MSRQELRPGHLWVQEGGRGEPTLLLLHGLGATGEVWGGVRDLLDQLRRHDPGAVQLSGLGHNAHVEDPERVLRLAEQTRGD